MGWDGVEGHSLELIGDVIPGGSKEDLTEFCGRLVGPKWAKVWLLYYVSEISHPDFAPLSVRLPEEVSLGMYLDNLAHAHGVD